MARLPFRRVFVTSGTTDANLKNAGGGTTGLDGADKICGAAAQSVSLGGSWRAWISDSTTDAIGHILDTSPWYLLDGQTQIFAAHGQLGSQPISPINLDEKGTRYPVGTGIGVWTGTARGGRKTTDTCGDWAFAGPSATAGDATKSTGEWTQQTGLPTGCGSMLHLYCFEQ